MSSKLFKSRAERRSSKSGDLSPAAITLPKSPSPLQNSFFEEKPLPPTPKSNGVLRRLLPSRRGSLILPRVMGSINRGMKRVRRHSIVAVGFNFTTSSPLKPIHTENEFKFETKINTKANTDTQTITSPPLSPVKLEPRNFIAERDEESEDENKSKWVDDYPDGEEVHIGVAVEMRITPVRARLIHIGRKD